MQVPQLAVENHMHDIASFVVDRSLQNSEIIACLKYAWVPPVDYAFPVNVEGVRKRKFQYKYLQQFLWLAYSESKQGAYCKWCVVFAFSGGGVGNQVNTIEKYFDHKINYYLLIYKNI